MRWPRVCGEGSGAREPGRERVPTGLSFFFDAHLDFFEEIAKCRAARRIWAADAADVGPLKP